ncbi:MAG: radical SAM protein [Desulfuromonadales bacterium]|nr:radical SAM protein [Desulfuromonadales bacterium]
MKIFPIFIPNLGCPGGCLYCDQRLNSGVAQAPTPEEIAERLKQQLPEAGLDQIAFYGGSFTALSLSLQNNYLQAVQPFLGSGQVDSLRISTRPDCIDGASAARLRRFGVKTVELGCQSFSDRVLAASGRGCRADSFPLAVTVLRDAGLSVGIQLMPGLPAGTDDEARNSLLSALMLKPDFLRIYPTVVLAGTRLAIDWQDRRYRAMSLDHAVDLCADLALICHEAEVPVIRFGLQASVDLDANGVLAGPYHPAFGQLVQSSLWLRAMRRLLAGRQTHVIQVHPHDLSTALGQRRSNLGRLHQQNPDLTIEPCNMLTRGQIQIEQTTVEMMAFAAGTGDRFE